MGMLQFLLPPNLPSSALAELKRGCITGGQDNMPFLTTVTAEPGILSLSRQDNESGCAAVPWLADRAGTLMSSTATLIEKPTPYPLVLELARGKVNQLRNQMADWLFGGLNTPPTLPAAIREATASLGRAIASAPLPESAAHAQKAIAQAYGAADQLVNTYIQQVFTIRHQRQPRLDTTLACRLGNVAVAEPLTTALRETFNTVCLPLSWVP